MEFKICTLEDKHLLRDIAEKTFRDAFERFNKKSDVEEYVSRSFSMEQVEKELSERDSVFIFAVQDENIKGYMKLNYAAAQTELQDSNSLEIERIYVLQEYQGQKIGQKLIDYAIDRAIQEKLKYIWLGVWDQNDGAIRFYERNGFYRFAEHPFMFGSEEQCDYMLRKDIE